MSVKRNLVDVEKFNPELEFPYELRREDFQIAMQDVYDFFYDVNANLVAKGLKRLDEMLRPAAMSGVVSGMLTQHSHALSNADRKSVLQWSSRLDRAGSLCK